MRQKFTRSFTEKAPGGWHWDTQVTGFGLAVRESGKRTFYVKTREGKRQVKIALGSPEVVDLEAARERAREIIQATRIGKPLSEVIYRPTHGYAVSDLAEQFLSLHRVRDSTLALYRIYWNKHIIPAIGTKQVRDLRRIDVERMHATIGKKFPSTANRVTKLLCGAINKMNRWGSGWPKIENPAAGTKLFREDQRERILTSDEVQRLAQELNRRTSANPDSAGAWLILVLMHTGLRVSEWRLATWSQVSFEKRDLRLYVTKNGRPRTVHLDQALIKILERIPRRGEFIFANVDQTSPIWNPRNQWEWIKKGAGLDPDLRLHDLRHTFASAALVGAGLSIKEVAELLGHANISTTARYLHLLDSQARSARDKAAAVIALQL